MSSDFCDGFICGELLGPPPIPPVDLLPRLECRDIISGCNAVSSLKGAFSNYSDPCLPPSTLSTSAVTSTEPSTTSDKIKLVTSTLTSLITGVSLDFTTTDHSIQNVTKSTQSLFYAGFPPWLIGVIVVAVIAVIVIIVVIITCIVRSSKGDRKKLKRSKLYKWLSGHLQGLRRCQKYFKTSRKSSTKHHRDNPKISLPDIIQGPHTPCSPGSLSPLTDREPVEFGKGPDTFNREPDEFSLKLNLTSDSFSEEVFKELNQSAGEYENTGNYCDLRNDSNHSTPSHYENCTGYQPTRNNQKVVVYVNTADIHHAKGKNSDSTNKNQYNQQKVKARTLGNEDLTTKLRNLDVSNDDIVLFDKESVQSLTVDSGYASRQVSNDNCTC